MSLNAAFGASFILGQVKLSARTSARGVGAPPEAAAASVGRLLLPYASTLAVVVWHALPRKASLERSEEKHEKVEVRSNGLCQPPVVVSSFISGWPTVLENGGPSRCGESPLGRSYAFLFFLGGGVVALMKAK